ncbi:delta-9 desaturase [Spinellus fusiger]|nr:delta-9 desaturase [Spinellus fusiger]
MNSTEKAPYTYTTSESPKKPTGKQNLPPLFDVPVTIWNWHEHSHKLFAFLLTTIPILAIYGVFTTELHYKTLILTIVTYTATGLGITAGYHRLWAHRAYQATTPLKIMLIIMSTAAFQGTIDWWVRDHRSHHRWTDTDKDPYCANRGFFYSHIGWLMVYRGRGKTGFADISDLRADKYIAFQRKYYPYLAIFFGFTLPVIIASLWGDIRGGFYYAVILRMTLVHHATFCVNSLAHILGEDTYDDFHTPRDHWLTAVITFGEGYHNFHHQFPQDYRNAILNYQYDPTKWLIKAFEMVGLAYDLKTFPTNEIKKGYVYMQDKKLTNIKKGLKYGTPIQELPVYTWKEYQTITTTKGKPWILIEGILYDLEGFDHPGGMKYITAGYGKDMTASFNGGVYNHSNGARNLLSMMRVGVLLNGMEVMKDSEEEEKEINALALDSYLKSN